LPYAECCGTFAKAPVDGGEGARAAFRRDLHDLYMYLFPLRNLYQAYWERLSQEDYPHHLLMADADYGRAVMANFFWDYSVQFSDARPVLRAARDVEEKNLRQANDFRQWSLSSLWFWEVLAADEEVARIRMMDSARTLQVSHGGELPGPGGMFAGRILPHRGREHVHPAVLILPPGSEEAARERLREAARNLGIRSPAGLRPDVQCDEWRRHGAAVLEAWRAVAYDARVGTPARTMTPARGFRLPVAARADAARRLRAGGAAPVDPARFDLRHRALTLARLELEPGDWLQVTLHDEAYRPAVLHWLADHLDAAPWDLSEASPLGAGDFPGAREWDLWAQCPREELNGETPQQASRHDFGRRRLEALLARLTLGDDAMALLRHRLGL
jgi:hypothetical protein